MKKKETIFEFLFKNKKCFAVCVSLNTFKSKGIDSNSRDYFLIGMNDELMNNKKWVFKCSDNYPNVCERDLSDNEILEFKTNINKFNKVIHNKYGRIYELKDNSFKKIHNLSSLEALSS